MSFSPIISVLGLGYVGLPLTVALAKHFPTIGYDINETRVKELRAGHDRTEEVEGADLGVTTAKLTADATDLAQANFHIITVPTPVDRHFKPDLTPIKSACRSLAPYLSKGDIVVIESTVFPGVTEDICAPLLAAESGLRAGDDFFMAYSPERINPGDKVHRLETITKVVSAETPEALARVEHVYGAIIDAGLHLAPTIKTAEAAKVIENTQRDLNIALMNELAMMFTRMGIRTSDVLAAAGTKWNFLPFTPGLVGGHCIGIDPYYLTAKAEEMGYHPQLILAGRRINNRVGSFIAQQTVKMMVQQTGAKHGGRIGILGLSFKENVPDLRNSRVVDIIVELEDYGFDVLVHDPWVDAAEAKQEYNVTLQPLEALTDLDAIIVAVPHRQFSAQGLESLMQGLTSNGVVIDIKALFAQTKTAESLTDGGRYWVF